MNVKKYLLCFSALSLGACASFDPVEYTRISTENILPRASFEMKCAKEEIGLVVIKSNQYGYPEEVGAEGCGNRFVYIRHSGQERWFIDSNLVKKGNASNSNVGNNALNHIMHHTP
ncbi:MAG: hypothetical protein RPR97_05515 [Colwellia sp.]|jgi:hypothetical protein